MPFELKNAKATFHRLMSIVFKLLIGNIMKVSINNMITKSVEVKDHYLRSLRDVFTFEKV